MKKKLFKPFAWLTCITILTSSCSSDEYTTPQTQNTISAEIPFTSINMDENGQLKMKFAESLANALIANQDLRRLVKEEALKKFDKDYDVMYQLVKNKSIIPIDYNGKSNGKIDKSTLIKSSQATTFRQAILPFFKNEAELIEIEQKLPLLTIFVPELPLGYFSAETWDVNDENQVPEVAFRLNTSNDIPVIGKDGNKYVIESEVTPGFPIIVIKENERLRVKQNHNNINKSAKLANVGFEDFEFIDENFDPNASTNNPPIVNNNGIDQFLIDSYNVWEGYGPGGWQRDNIYYGLTPSISNGKVSGKYREYITSFAMKGDPNVAYLTVSGHTNDPSKVTDYRLNDSSGWTDGKFEFRAYCFFGAPGAANNSSVVAGTSTTKGMSFKPSDLFELKYEAFSRFNWPFKKTYIRTTVVGIKTINFLDPKYNLSPELETWDLERFSNEWKFSFEEVDNTFEITKSETINQKSNMNFGIDANTGEKVKLGIKFGISNEKTQATFYSIKYTEKSDFLGDIFVPFYDNVVNKNPNTQQIYTRSYSTGYIQFEVRPIQVQW
ncbi:hypothetical protein ACNQGP_04035 [Flavobacterium sp. GT2N3]|uniref:hypothetical protein n=1 Tax=unclassified Flavobacterium TaxID=196869 RepID=UPI003AAAACFD